MPDDPAVLQCPHGVAEDVAGNGLDDVLHEFRAVALDPLPFLRGADTVVGDGFSAVVFFARPKCRKGDGEGRFAIMMIRIRDRVSACFPCCCAMLSGSLDVIFPSFPKRKKDPGDECRSLLPGSAPLLCCVFSPAVWLLVPCWPGTFSPGFQFRPAGLPAVCRSGFLLRSCVFAAGFRFGRDPFSGFATLPKNAWNR